MMRFILVLMFAITTGMSYGQDLIKKDGKIFLSDGEKEVELKMDEIDKGIDALKSQQTEIVSVLDLYAITANLIKATEDLREGSSEEDYEKRNELIEQLVEKSDKVTEIFQEVIRQRAQVNDKLLKFYQLKDRVTAKMQE